MFSKYRGGSRQQFVQSIELFFPTQFLTHNSFALCPMNNGIDESYKNENKKFE